MVFSFKKKLSSNLKMTFSTNQMTTLKLDGKAESSILALTTFGTR